MELSHILERVFSSKEEYDFVYETIFFERLCKKCN